MGSLNLKNDSALGYEVQNRSELIGETDLAEKLLISDHNGKQNNHFYVNLEFSMIQSF